MTLLGTEEKGTVNWLFITESFLHEQNILTSVKGALDVLNADIKTALLLYLKDVGREVEDERFPCLIGYEFMKTPTDTCPQDPHGDTRHNIVAAFISLDNRKTKSTFVASSIAFPPGTSMKALKYTQFEVPSSHTDPHVVFNHAAWPHYGPGNMSQTDDRYMLFVTYALDETACRHSTTEAVLRVL